MPDKRKHRGPHPQDETLFAAEHHAALRRATNDLSELLDKGYSLRASLKLVGDHFQLTTRQREAVNRSACPSSKCRSRLSRMRLPAQVNGRELLIDGFNVLTTLEAAMSGGVLLAGRDSCLRDLASMHGHYHQIRETLPAVGLLLHYLQTLPVGGIRIFLDRPVSNSGRLAATIRQTMSGFGLPDTWLVDVVADPDPILENSGSIVATADGIILDQCQAWFNLARKTVEWGSRCGVFPKPVWIVDLGAA